MTAAGSDLCQFLLPILHSALTPYTGDNFHSLEDEWPQCAVVKARSHLCCFSPPLYYNPYSISLTNCKTKPSPRPHMAYPEPMRPVLQSWVTASRMHSQSNPSCFRRAEVTFQLLGCIGYTELCQAARGALSISDCLTPQPPPAPSFFPVWNLSRWLQLQGWLQPHAGGILCPAETERSCWQAAQANWVHQQQGLQLHAGV